ncbi:ABC transporter ATP-binding protein [Acidicapsa dinghuensis]|uniref:ABC transporter ATP-binding protein n=1 Tax=Acidicapsa dinghuensis TaxID=2218256 RepID=A0ABW1ECK8_9BACT|nr:ABC transporter ATP-binding protein [Acidicapsa dinghuensis]
MPESFAIETRDLGYRFGSLIAVEALNLRVPKGSICGFLGPNGAGKTTTIRLLLGLLNPSSGSVLIDGQPFSSARRHLRSRIGALIETPSLYPNLSARENLEVFRRLLEIDSAKISEVLHLVRLTDDSDRLVRTYSLGMKQRLGLAVALLGYPGLVILDEPVNGLDPAGVHEFRDLLRALVKQHGATVFLSSHLLAEVEQIADHIAILNRGRLLFQGSLGAFQAQRNKILILRVDRPEDAASVLRLSGWQVERRPNGTLSVTIAQMSDTAAVNALLGANDLAVYHLAQEEESLESLFLKATGRLEEHV